jgi:hypothetical protein
MPIKPCKTPPRHPPKKDQINKHKKQQKNQSIKISLFLKSKKFCGHQINLKKN